jgi:hypothetical protein
MKMALRRPETGEIVPVSEFRGFGQQVILVTIGIVTRA